MAVSVHITDMTLGVNIYGWKLAVKDSSWPKFTHCSRETWSEKAGNWAGEPLLVCPIDGTWLSVRSTRNYLQFLYKPFMKLFKSLSLICCHLYVALTGPARQQKSSTLTFQTNLPQQRRWAVDTGQLLCRLLPRSTQYATSLGSIPSPLTAHTTVTVSILQRATSQCIAPTCIH